MAILTAIQGSVRKDASTMMRIPKDKYATATYEGPISIMMVQGQECISVTRFNDHFTNGVEDREDWIALDFDHEIFEYLQITGTVTVHSNWMFHFIVSEERALEFKLKFG